MITDKLTAAFSIKNTESLPSITLNNALTETVNAEYKANTAKTLEQDTVTISTAARTNAAAEQEQEQEQEQTEELTTDDMHKLATGKSGETASEEVDSGLAIIDELIEELEERIKELEAKIEPLKAKGDVGSQERLELLQKELLMIQTQLFELQSQKAEIIKNAKDS